MAGFGGVSGVVSCVLLVKLLFKMMLLFVRLSTITCCASCFYNRLTIAPIKGAKGIIGLFQTGGLGLLMKKSPADTHFSR
jgi:hypothetical protein